MARLVFATVARHGFEGAVTDGEVRDALTVMLSGSPATVGRIDAASARLVAEHILSRGEPSADAPTELRVLTRAPLRTGVAEILAGLLHPDARKRLRDAAAVAERLAALALDANTASGEVALHIG